MKLKKIFPLMAASFSLLFAFDSFAGRETGNGGDLVRLDIVSIRSLVYSRCDQWMTFQKANVPCAQMKEKMDEVGTGPDRLIIQDEVDLGDGIPRSGKNEPSIPAVTFSRSFWLASKSDTAAKIGIEAHEFLGLIGIEKTDDYHISNALINEIRATSLVASGNKDFLEAATEVDALMKVANNCKIPSQKRSDAFYRGLQIIDDTL